MVQARYTEVLKNLMDDENVKPLIDKALSTYPLYVKKSKEEYIPSIVPTREQLNSKILNAYKYREIGFETVGRFLDELEISMNEIMPYYNQMLFSADQDFNILFNVDYQRTTTADREGSHSGSLQGNTSNTLEAESTATTSATDSTSSSTSDTQNTDSTATDTSSTDSTANHNAKAVKSSTPQNEISVSAANIDTVSYADEVNWNKDQTTNTASTEGTSTATATTTGTATSETEGEHAGTSTGTNSETATGTNTETTTGSNTEKETILETTKGNFGVVSSQDLILKYRELILNIEQMIVNDERISELFMRIY